MTFTDDRPTARAVAAPQPATGPPHTRPLAATEPPTAADPARAATRWEQCDQCQSPVDQAQRYCVVCGTNQRRADDPVTRFFVAARRSRTAVAVAPAPTGRTVSTTVAALLIALLPVAAGIGIVVGRGSADSGDQVIEALKAVRGTQTAGAATGAAAMAPADEALAATNADADAAKKAKASDGGKVEGIDTSTEQAPILASGPTGNARKLEDTKPTKKDIEESKKAVDQINSRKGKEYIDQQRDLPDSIVIP